MSDSICTEDLIEQLLVELLHVAEAESDNWKTSFIGDDSQETLCTQLCLLTMAQSMLIIEGKLDRIAKSLEKHHE